MEKYTISQACSLHARIGWQGLTKKEYLNDGDFYLVTGVDFSDGKIDFQHCHYVAQERYEQDEHIQLKPLDVLVTKDGTIGKVAIVESLDKPATLNSGVFVVRPNDPKDLLPEFLVFALRSGHFSRFIEQIKVGCTIAHLNQEKFLKYEIPHISVSQQKHIIAVLSHAEATIKARQQQLQQLDELVKARFVEMFGDPATNPMNWNKVNISEVVGGKVSNGFFAKRDDYVEVGNVAVMGVAYVVNRMYSQWQGLPKTNATDKDIEKFEVKYGDMLFCRSSLVAEGIGKASIVPEDVPNNTLFECHVIRLPLDLNKCVPEYMQVLSTTEFFRQQIIAQSKTATMTTIGQDGILKADIILPPLEKQKEFYAFVKQVDKSKSVAQKALDEAQLLFDSLMQKYFG